VVALVKKVSLSGSISYGSLETIKKLIKNGADVNPKTGLGPLFFAIERGDSDIVKVLIENGADLNAKCLGNNSLLLWAVIRAEKKSDEEVIKVLIENGADVNSSGQAGLFPIHVAAANGKIEIVEALIKNGADINAKSNLNNLSNDEITPLFLAADGGHREVVESLIKNGADINLTGLDEKALLDMADLRKDMFFSL
jgi:ankyrin repeat protein